MLNEIRKILRRSVDAFRDEMNAREPEDRVAELLMAMRRELVAARAALPEYEAEARRAREELEQESGALEQCRRRGALAERIGDRETVRVAEEFAARHLSRIEVLAQKVSACEAELTLRRSEAEEMRLRYREADANRFALLAHLRRSGPTQSTGPSSAIDSAEVDWSRMEERVERDVSIGDAISELQDSSSPPGRFPDPEGVEERLRELKRRLGRD